MAIIDRLRELVEPLCLELDLEIYDLEMNGGVFRVAVDRAGGVGLADIAELTRSISRALDLHDPIAGRYTLEVTSPGLERPLRTPEHFRRAIGAPVKLKLVPHAEAGRRLEGVVAAADESAVVLRTVRGAELRLAYDLVEKARTVFEWGPTPRPGGSTRPKQAKKQPSGAAATDAAASTTTSPAGGAAAAAEERPASSDAVKVVNA